MKTDGTSIHTFYSDNKESKPLYTKSTITNKIILRWKQS